MGVQLELWYPGPAPCPGCGDDDDFRGLDARFGVGEHYITWAACCEFRAFLVEEEGWASAYGITLLDALHEACLIPNDTVEIIDHGDGTIVARLHVDDPTACKPGPVVGVASSPPGWRSEVFAEVDQHHRHHDAPQGHKFSVSVHNGGVRVGVAVVGRPVARLLAEAEPRTLEVTRVCTWGHPALRYNGASKLYAAAAARARALGADKLVTYTIAGEESGVSLRASGFVPVATSAGGSWSRRGRARTDKAPTSAKVRWERGLTKKTRRQVAAQEVSP